jgi:hypothetical protein
MTSLDSADLETQRRSLPREESIESFTGDQSMRVDSTVADRGLDCYCGVDVRLFFKFVRLILTRTPQREDTDTCWCDSCGRWYHVWYEHLAHHAVLTLHIPSGVWGP